MDDLLDDKSNPFSPSELDLERLNALEPDGQFISESKAFVVLRYPPKKDSPAWCEYTLIAHDAESGVMAMHPIECATIALILSTLKTIQQEFSKWQKKNNRAE